MRSGKCSLGLVVVVVIIFLVLAAIMFPVFTSTRHPPGRDTCLNNLKQCAQALKMYADDYEGAMPSSYLVRNSKKWNKRDSLYFCTKRGNIASENSPRRTWAEALYHHMKMPDRVFCPKDEADTEARNPTTSYWYKVANDKAWYGVGCKKPCRNMSDYGYESDQLAFYERLGWHCGDTSGLENGVQINASFIDTHVETVYIEHNATSGDPVNCAVNSDGAPMYYNTRVDPESGQATKQKGPATYTDPTCCYDESPLPNLQLAIRSSQLSLPPAAVLP